MIETSVGFKLSAYLRSISAAVALPSGENIEMEEIAYSEWCRSGFGVMMHDLWASGIGGPVIIKEDIGVLRLEYHISFTGHESEAPGVLEMPVPLLARGTAEEQFGRRWRETGEGR